MNQPPSNKVATPIPKLVVRLQVFADNYAKAKLTQAPSEFMAMELKSMVDYLEATGYKQ